MNSEKKSRGRSKNMHTPIKYFTEEEKKDAIRPSKTRQMVNKEWTCIVCDNHDYTLSGKCKLNISVLKSLRTLSIESSCHKNKMSL